MRLLMIISLMAANVLVWTALAQTAARALAPAANATVIYKQEDQEALGRLIQALEPPVISWDI